MNLNSKLMLIAAGLVMGVSTSFAAPATQKGSAVAYPWVFTKGTDTARQTALTAASEILQKANYAAVGADEAQAAWTAGNFPMPAAGATPSQATLKAFGKAVKASKVIYGSVSWHTRSIWVGAGPKTISTATVNAYVFDVKSSKVIYWRKGVQGRSDEKANGYKIAAAVLLTPLVTAVSGGPATPREQRAVQIAMGKAFGDWVNR